MLCNLKFFPTFAINEDNFVFQLLYRWTAIILVIFSSIVTFKLWLGNSFACVSRDDIPLNFVKYHCYANGTYIVRSSWSKRPGDEVPYRGIDKYSSGEIRTFLTYYGWVNLFLLAQAFNFYLPRLLWKAYERGFLQKLVIGIDELSADEDKKSASLDVLAKYIVQSYGRLSLYPTVFIFCEVLNHIVAVCQIFWLMDFFGIAGVQEVNFETWNEFYAYYFPLVSKCGYFMYGRSGDVQRHDVLCNLPLNTTYRLMYRFLYTWYIILASATALNLVYRLSLLNLSVRLQVLKRKASFAQDSHLQFICGRASYSDWFLLSRVQMNLRQDNFADLMGRISTMLHNSEKIETFEIGDTMH